MPRLNPCAKQLNSDTIGNHVAQSAFCRTTPSIARIIVSRENDGFLEWLSWIWCIRNVPKTLQTNHSRFVISNGSRHCDWQVGKTALKSHWKRRKAKLTSGLPRLMSRHASLCVELCRGQTPGTALLWTWPVCVSAAVKRRKSRRSTLNSLVADWTMGQLFARWIPCGSATTSAWRISLCQNPWNGISIISAYIPH